METTAASTREILGRSRIELLRAMEGFEHTGIRPPVVRGALFEDSSSAKLMLTILAAIAELERN